MAGNDLFSMGVTALLFLTMLALAVTCWRLVVGPTVMDRIVALDMLTGVAVTIAALVVLLTGRREFLDVAFGSALVSFVGIVALAGFVERKGRRRR